jgi:TRAP-type C4-dicarboxylate transport system substrate-binding protein
MKILSVSMLALVLLTLVAGGATVVPTPADAQAKPVVWNLPHVAAPTYYHTINYTAFASKVKEKSQGRMEIRVHPASSLYPSHELIPALVDGRAEIGPVVSGYLTDILLEIGVLDLPFMTAGLDEHRKAANALRPFFTEMLAKRGLKLLAINAWPTQQLFSLQAMKTIGDWKGKKIRVYGADSANTARALGAAPVSLGFGEVYTALEKKTVDGAITSATNAEPMKFFEVSKFINYWNIAGAGSEWFVVNQKAFDALPKDLQQVVMDALKEVRLEDKEWEDAAAWDARAKQRCGELGMTVVEPSKDEIEKARKAARAGWDTWLTRTGADGKRGMDLALKALGR